MRVQADTVLHRDREWRGIFREQDAGFLGLETNTDRLLVDLHEQNMVKGIAGASTTLASGLIKQLRQHVYPWEERIIMLPLTRVYTRQSTATDSVTSFPVGNQALPAALRHLRWMFVRVTEDARSQLLVWLDEQLMHGKLIG